MHFLREIVYVKEKIQFFKQSTIVFASKENQGIENFREIELFEKNRETVCVPFFCNFAKFEKNHEIKFRRISQLQFEEKTNFRQTKPNAISHKISKFTQKSQGSISRNLLIGIIFINRGLYSLFHGLTSSKSHASYTFCFRLFLTFETLSMKCSLTFGTH